MRDIKNHKRTFEEILEEAIVSALLRFSINILKALFMGIAVAIFLYLIFLLIFYPLNG